MGWTRAYWLLCSSGEVNIAPEWPYFEVFLKVLCTTNLCFSRLSRFDLRNCNILWKVTLQILCFFAVYKQRFCNDIAKKWSRSQRWRPTFIILWNVVTVPKADLQWVYIFEKFAAHCMMCWTLIEKKIPLKYDHTMRYPWVWGIFG